MARFFIAGSGTDIGKTYLTCALIRELRRRHIDVDAVKPVMSGFDPSRPLESDAARIAEALGEPPSASVLARISPLCFRAPQSPDIAACREGRELSLPLVIKATRLRENAAVGLAETIGGVCVPLGGGATVCEWMAHFGYPAILVVGAYLGGLSHAITAYRALIHAGAAVACVAINPGAAPAKDIEPDEFMRALAPHINAPCLMLDVRAVCDLVVGNIFV